MNNPIASLVVCCLEPSERQIIRVHEKTFTSQTDFDNVWEKIPNHETVGEWFVDAFDSNGGILSSKNIQYREAMQLLSRKM